MLTPEISVIIPLYNKERYVQRAVNSVLEQSLAPLEVVVVDDGSTDGSAEAVAALGPDQRLRLVSQRNQGVSAARNRGVAEARGRFVAFLDADDQWQPEFLETLQWLRELFPEGCFFATGFEVIYSDGSRRAR
ncbi:glycosyltransferase family 2 protein [Geomonas sp. Red32]|uniref:glycosyltransferase family 2 protein n=1 Tax=Geomonas sp. Red32 TaxID=2912856 RepID=UPI00202CDF5A|nr:glycosyltransferase family A protein [Geomonas sp. Red32]MCM0083341.1 glycosyltransferase family 2 protein [Geomonas sp. Red32]